MKNITFTIIYVGDDVLVIPGGGAPLPFSDPNTVQGTLDDADDITWVSCMLLSYFLNPIVLLLIE